MDSPRRLDDLRLYERAAPLPMQASQVPDESFHARCPLPPRRVRRLLVFVASPTVAGFTLRDRPATLDLLNEALERGSLALRLTCLPSRASPASATNSSYPLKASSANAESATGVNERFPR